MHPVGRATLLRQWMGSEPRAGLPTHPQGPVSPSHPQKGLLAARSCPTLTPGIRFRPAFCPQECLW